MKKVFFSIALLYLFDFHLNAMENACIAFEPSRHIISRFDDQRDTQEFLALINMHREVLIRRPDFSVDDMLRTKSITPDKSETYGSLLINVLRAPCDNSGLLELKAFAAYAMTDSKTAQAYLLAVKKEDQGKGYAQCLVRHGIEEVLASGAARLWTMTRKVNVPAQRLYKKIAASYPQLELDIKEASAVIVNNPAVTDAIVFELRVKN